MPTLTNINDAMHAKDLFNSAERKFGLSNRKPLRVKIMCEKASVSHFQQIFQVDNSGSIIPKKITQVARFKRFEAAWILCFFAVSCYVFFFLACLFLALPVPHITRHVMWLCTSR